MRAGFVFPACFILTLLVIVGDALVASNLFWRATGLKLSEQEIGSSPIPAGATERALILPVTGIDGKWWIIHTEQMIREGRLRVRNTGQDNSPAGREVHWSSGLNWFVAGLSWMFNAWIGMPVMEGVPIAVMYGGPVLFAILLAIYAWVFQRRYGWVAAGIGLLILGTCSLVFELFRAGNWDHHGVVGWFAAMSILCLSAGGAGCVARKKSRKRDAKADLQDFAELPPEGPASRWFIASGIFGAAGLWVSTATQIPVLVGTAAGALLAGWFFRKTEALEPKLWIVWGRAGCVASLCFYLIEYFPNHMGWRLEVNHPLYALAWLGGGWLLARTISFFSGKSFSMRDPRDLFRLGASLLLVVLPPVLILARPQDVFWVSDHFLLALHTEHIGEFQPFLKAIAGPAMGIIFAQAMILPALSLLTIGFLAFRRSIPPQWISPVVVTLIPALLMLALGMRQIRWLGIALFLWSLLLALLAALVIREKLWKLPGKWMLGTLALLALAAVSFFPFMTFNKLLKGAATSKEVPKALLPDVVARDVVQRILRANPARMPVLLSGPTTSTDLAYYGGVRVIGSLYWENMPGLKTAAEIFSAPSEEIARKKLLDRGVTHILLFSWDEFTKDYVKLLKLDAGHGADKPGEMFITRLLAEKEMPQWIRPLYYPIPPAFDLKDESVSLFEIVPDQTRLDSLIAQAVYRIDAGQYPRALDLLQTALAEYPDSDAVRQLIHSAEEASRTKEQK